MKTMSLNNRMITMLMFAIISLSLFSCKDDEDLTPIKDELPGTWDITSYKLGGDEYMGLIFESASLTFSAYAGEEGEFTEVVKFADEEEVSLTGPYKVLADGVTIRMVYEEDVIFAKIRITDGNKMIWDGTQDGFPLVIKANKQ